MRVADDIARRVRDGHPWIFADALHGRELNAPQGAIYDIVDRSGAFVARAVHDPTSAILLRAFSREPDRHLSPPELSEAVARAARIRRRWLLEGPGVAARVLQGDAEGVPAVNADRYGAYLVVTAYSAVVETYLDPLLDALAATWRPRGIYFQRRYRAPAAGRARPGGELLRGDPAPTEVTVAEGRLRYLVDVTAPLGTGLFPDMRLGRAAALRVAAGARVLNCFSYTGAFSVAAACGGAEGVVSVDSAARAHARARRNFALNGLDPDDQRHGFLTADTFAALARLAARGERFGLVILDPPTFSTGGRSRPFAAARDYAALVSAALSLVERDGLLLAASNAVKLPDADFDRAVARGGADARRELTTLERIPQPPDFPAPPGFPEASYLKVRLVRVG